MLRLALLCTSLAIVGCSTQATIHAASGEQREAEIVHSDDGFIYFESDQYGSEAIRRQDVKDIDHPGDVAAGLGTAVTAVGLLLVSLGIASSVDCSGDLCGLGLVLLGTPGAVLMAGGLPPMIWGWANWAGSSSAASRSGPPRGDLPLDARAPALSLSF